MLEYTGAGENVTLPLNCDFNLMVVLYTGIVHLPQ